MKFNPLPVRSTAEPYLMSSIPFLSNRTGEMQRFRAFARAFKDPQGKISKSRRLALLRSIFQASEPILFGAPPCVWEGTNAVFELMFTMPKAVEKSMSERDKIENKKDFSVEKNAGRTLRPNRETGRQLSLWEGKAQR